MSPPRSASSAIEQVADLAAAAGPYGTLVNVLAYTGLRWGEAAALRAGASTWPAAGWRSSRPPPRSAARSSSAPPRPTSAARCPSRGSSPSRSPGSSTGKAADDLVFTSPDGHVLRNTNFRHRVFDPAARQAGLPGLTPHELRHTAASLAVAAGANIKAVQQMLGHASAAMTLDVYAGLFADDLDAVAERLDEAATRRVLPESADFLRTRRPRDTGNGPCPDDRERGRDLR